VAEAPADDQADLRKLLERAIKASGGEKKLRRYQAAVTKFKGKDYSMGEFLYTGELAAQYPDRQRLIIRTEEDGQVNTEVTVVHKNKGWVKEEGRTKAMSKARLAEEREQMYTQWVAELLPLRDKAFTLAPLGEIRVGRRDTVGLKVTRKGHRPVNLFFDKKTTLLVKMDARVRDEASGKEVWEESMYDGYQAVQGVQVAMKVEIRRDGKKYVEETVTEIQLRQTQDDAHFAKP
jgi:hypothetical protein